MAKIVKIPEGSLLHGIEQLIGAHSGEFIAAEIKGRHKVDGQRIWEGLLALSFQAFDDNQSVLSTFH